MKYDEIEIGDVVNVDDGPTQKLNMTVTDKKDGWIYFFGKARWSEEDGPFLGPSIRFIATPKVCHMVCRPVVLGPTLQVGTIESKGVNITMTWTPPVGAGITRKGGTFRVPNSEHELKPGISPKLTGKFEGYVRETNYVSAMLKDHGVRDLAAMIIPGKDVGGSYRWCMRCQRYVERDSNNPRFRTQLYHERDCLVAKELGVR